MMKKKLVLLLSFVFVLVASLGILSACTAKVTVTMTPTEATVSVGKSVTLVATASDGSKLEWASDTEDVATVNNNGKVTGVKTGTAVITAKSGSASASCTVTVTDPVTFVFKDKDGKELTELTVDRNGQPVQIVATASDGSAIKSWSSADEKIATVTSEGVVTGVKEGETTLTVRTATDSAPIKVTVVDTFNGVHYDMTTEKSIGKWWYYASEKDNRSPEINLAEVRGDEATFDFSGNCNWSNGDIQICLRKDATAKTGWTAVSGKINSSVDGSVTIFDTIIPVTKGDNTFEVYYDQSINEEMVYISPNNNITEGRLVISDLKWADYTRVQLKVPSFTLEGNTVKITDSANAKGVKEYKIGFFNSASDANPAYVQSFSVAGGDIDVSAIEQNGTYILKIQAVGISGFIDSEWSATTTEYVVANSDISYELDRTTTPSSTRWVYYEVREDSANTTEASYKDGVVTYESDYLGWKFDSTQMFRHYAQFPVGATLKLVMTINTNTRGRILISGQLVTLEEGNNNIELFISQPASGATITILFGDPDVVNADNWATYTHIAFKISVKSIGEFVPTQLATPSATYTAAQGENPAKITITDNNDKTNVAKYEVGFFNAANELIGAVTIKENGTFSDLAIKDGTYSLKIRAVGANVAYSTSEWSNAITTGYTVANGGITYNVAFGGDGDTPNAAKNPDTWYYWNDQNWTGSSVTINQAIFSGNTLTVSYTVNAGACDFGVQLYFKNTKLVVDNTYKLTLKIHVDEATDVVINGNSFSLVKGDNNVTVYYKEAVGIGYSISMQIKVNKEILANNTIVLSGMVWDEYTYVTLKAPEIAIDNNGTVTITDTNTAGVAGYVAGFFKSGAEAPAASVAVVNGEKIDTSKIENGEYTVKLMAKAGNGYSDSAWSTGITYTVNNAGGVKYDIPFGGSNDTPNADKDPGTWYYWADQWWCGSKVTVSSAKYENGTINFAFTSEGACDFGLQLLYVNPNYVAGTTYTFDIVATADMDIQVEAGGDTAVTHLKAGEKVTLTGGKDASFYIQVNIKNNVAGSVTISNVVWG